MRLRTLAGRYAGEIRDYHTPVGLNALRSGTAARVEDPPPRQVSTAREAAKPVLTGKRRK